VISQICWIERFLNFFFVSAFCSLLLAKSKDNHPSHYLQHLRMENKSWDLNIGQLDAPDSLDDYVRLCSLSCTIRH
jgi:hypothetical protein